MTDTEARTADGEARKAAGVKRAATSQKSGGRCDELKRRVLRLALAGRRFTIDDLSTPGELEGNLGGNAPHRGAALVSCSVRGFIRQTGERRKSTRPHRHAGTNPVWEAAATRAELLAELFRLHAESDRHREPARPLYQGTLPFGDE